jgi:AraC-like DNA-binding protein
LPKGAPEAGRIAKTLGLGERTLARHLSSEGTSYQRVVNDLRRDAARSYLSDPELSIGQVAYLLGYSEQSAFTTAFRRWTGQSPRAYRSALKVASKRPR